MTPDTTPTERALTAEEEADVRRLAASEAAALALIRWLNAERAARAEPGVREAAHHVASALRFHNKTPTGDVKPCLPRCACAALREYDRARAALEAHGGPQEGERWSGNDNPVSVTVWWTPDCGYLHVETDPVTVPVHCPDGVEPPQAPEGER